MVVVVDDDPLVRRCLARELRRDFQVLEADGPAAALEVLTLLYVSAVVSDLDMDGNALAGMKLLEQVQANFPGCARLLVSGSPDALAASAGADRFIEKPWRPGEVVAAVRTLLETSSTPSIPTPSQEGAGR